MESRLVIIMDNGKEYEFFKTFKINHIDDMGEAIHSLCFLEERPNNHKNFVTVGLIGGTNVVVNEDKISSFEFRPINKESGIDE